jgi:hypothetical protein
LDQTGELTIDQFFLWCLENASIRHGEDVLRKLFTKYDHDESASGRASNAVRRRILERQFISVAIGCRTRACSGRARRV